MTDCIAMKICEARRFALKQLLLLARPKLHELVA